MTSCYREGDVASEHADCRVFLDDIFINTSRGIRLFSPDERKRNRLSAVLNYTGRNFHCPETSHARGGRVTEIFRTYFSGTDGGLLSYLFAADKNPLFSSKLERIELERN